MNKEKQKLLKEMYEQGRFDAIADLEKEGKVVINKEEYENLKKELKEMEEQRDEQAYITEDLIQEKHLWTEQARKETAEKFARKVKEVISILKTEFHASGEEYLGIEDCDIDQIANNLEWI